MLDVRRMRVLREVAARGSFSAAAEALSFTQSAVSQHVAALERETGVKLVERGSRGIRLTEAGEAIVRHADVVIARLDDAEEELRAIAGLRGGRLRLAGFQSAGATLLPRAVRQFHELHPEVELGMVQAEPAEATALLRTGDIDLALVYDVEAIPGMLDEDLELVHLIDDPYRVLLPETHPLAGRKRLRLADLADESWVKSTATSGCRRITFRACQEAGFEPRVAFEADDIATGQALVATGVGAAMFPQLALTTLHPGVVARSMGPDTPVRRILAARLESDYRSPASEAMVQILQDVAEDFSAEDPALAAVS